MWQVHRMAFILSGQKMDYENYFKKSLIKTGNVVADYRKTFGSENLIQY